MNKDMSDVAEVLDLEIEATDGEEKENESISHNVEIKKDLSDIRDDLKATTELISSTLAQLENEIQDIIDGVEIEEFEGSKKKQLNIYSIADLMVKLSDIKLKYHKELVDLHKKKKILLEIKSEEKEENSKHKFSAADLIKELKKDETKLF